MKVKNLNNSSVKTRKLIKDTFIEMLAEKKEISKISVSELVERAHICRATFYAHFDDIYGVVGEFEREITDKFYSNVKLLATDDYEKFFEELFEFMGKNQENYRLMCRTNDFLFSAEKLSGIIINKLTELCNASRDIKDRQFLEIEISVFVEGLLCEYVKYCRGLAAAPAKQLYQFALNWYKTFMKQRCGQ